MKQAESEMQNWQTERFLHVGPRISWTENMRELGYGETTVKTRYTDYSVGCSKKHSLCLKYATASMCVHVIYIQNSRRED